MAQKNYAIFTLHTFYLLPKSASLGSPHHRISPLLILAVSFTKAPKTDAFMKQKYTKC
jgi:hypothetical protein